MQVVYRRCCGLDVHMDAVTACVLILGENGAREVRKKEFRTDLKSLYNLMLWLFACKVEHAAMESTGVYWKPVWNVLEGQIPVLLANPYHMKNIPGRKTDQNDAEWIADLLAHGLLRASFVPPREIRDLRDLTRYRVKLSQECNRIHNRIEKILEDANIKLGSVASDILGVSGREMISRIAAGCERPDEMADLAINQLHASRAEVRRALYGRVRDHHRYMLQQLLEDLDHVETKMLRVEAEIIRQMQPYEEQMRRLLTIPGINVITVWTLIAELGVDMTKFADADHAASWAGLVPGNHESAGKRKSGRTRYGNRWLRRALCQSAWAVSHKKDCHLTAFFFRQASRRGEKKAIIATAHRLLVIAFHILQDGSEYRESGGDLYDRLHPERTRKRLTRRLQRLGFEVSLRPIDLPLSELPAPRPRGRPCKCTERGLVCSHIARKSEGLDTKNTEDSAF
jgi:transposase